MAVYILLSALNVHVIFKNTHKSIIDLSNYICQNLPLKSEVISIFLKFHMMNLCPHCKSQNFDNGENILEQINILLIIFYIFVLKYHEVLAIVFRFYEYFLRYR